MKQATVKTDTACALHGTSACAVLNQRMCEDCPAHRDGHAHVQETAKFVAQFESLLPEGGIAPLFESETCQLCKTEPKGEKSGYAIVDFGHTEPKEMHSRKLFRNGNVGFMVPLQFACCRKCRTRMLVCSYLPLVAPVVLTALTLPVLLNPHAIAALRAVAGWLPVLIVALAVGIGYAVGRILQNVLRQKFSASMYFDPLTHPMSMKMREKGWFPLFGEKHSQPVFSKKRMQFGLGTASQSDLDAAVPQEAPDED